MGTSQQTPAQSGHPTPVAAHEVAARFHRAATRHGIVDMEELNVRIGSIDDPCGTIACAAGHYMLQKAIDELDSHATDAQRTAGQRYVAGSVDWKRGTRMIANDLAMEDEKQLLEWARANPQLWGNKNGQEMFYQEEAYDSTESTLTLGDIARHWDRVADRIAIETLGRLAEPG